MTESKAPREGNAPQLYGLTDLRRDLERAKSFNLVHGDTLEDRVMKLREQLRMAEGALSLQHQGLGAQADTIRRDVAHEQNQREIWSAITRDDLY